ncbi:MAG TPA: hypothetical protein ENK14_01500, partial [Caldithrix sp.]|nr:hypothetical protein [Caldithrix sp.]
MNQTRFSILWKFFSITGLIFLIVAAVVTNLQISKQKNSLERQAVEFIRLAAQMTSITIQSADIEQSLTAVSMQSDGYDRVDSELRRQFQVFNQASEHFKIARVSVLVPGENSSRIFCSTTIPFRFMDKLPLLPEMAVVIEQNTIQVKKDYRYQDKTYYSAFAPIRDGDHKVIALVQVDVDKREI